MKRMISERINHESMSSRIVDHLLKKELKRRAQKHNQKRTVPLAVFGNDWIGINVNVNGIYEEQHILDLVNILKNLGLDLKDSTAIDIGANIGNHAIEFSNIFRNVVCLEPNPRAFDILAANTKNIGNIEIHNWGCSSTSERIRFQEDFNNIGGSSAAIDVASSNEIEIQVRPLDDLALSFKNVALIKIDVEGMEFSALKGAKNIISMFHPIICLEQHEAEFGADYLETQSIDFLRTLGYRVFCLDKSHHQNFICKRLNNIKDFLLGAADRRVIIEYEHLPRGTYPMIYAVHSNYLN